MPRSRSFTFWEIITDPGGSRPGAKDFRGVAGNLAPGGEIPEIRHEGEVAALTLQGTGRMMVDGEKVEIRPDTTGPHSRFLYFILANGA